VEVRNSVRGGGGSGSGDEASRVYLHLPIVGEIRLPAQG